MKKALLLAVIALTLFGCKTPIQAPDNPKPATENGGAGDNDPQPQHVVVSDQWKALLPETYGINTQTANGPSWSDQLFMTRLAGLSLGNMRYPGGTIGNYWDWKTGAIKAVDDKDPAKGPTKGNMSSNNIYRPEELDNGVIASGAMPIFMVNMLTSNLSYQMEMLASAAGMGLPIKYVELGNEFYLSYTQGGDATYKDPATGLYDKYGDYANVPYHYATAKQYADTCEYYISEIHKLYPDAKIAFQGVVDDPTAAYFKNSPRTVNWNADMKRYITSTKYLTIHDYPNIDDYPNHGTRTPAGALKITLDQYKADMAFVAATYPGYKVWFTEYNNKTDSNNGGFRRNLYAGMWIHGIISSLSTAYLMTSPQVEITCIHDIASGITSGLVFAGDTKITVAWNDASQVTGKNLEYTASGVAHSLLGRVALGAESVQPLSVTSNPVISTEKGNIESLQGALFKQGDATRMFVVNASDKATTLGIANLTGISTVETATAASPTSFILSSADYNIDKKIRFADKTVDLPPWSITIIY